ncbi:MAG: sugar dehydratase, partial [Candidatus Dormiibacterota bacterium]
VDDAINAYLMLAERADEDGIAGRAFNFGANQPIKVIDLTQAILSSCGRSDLEPDIRGTGKLGTEIDQQYLDSGMAHSVLGWTPSKTLEGGLVSTVEWYRGHFQTHGFGEA